MGNNLGAWVCLKLRMRIGKNCTYWYTKKVLIQSGCFISWLNISSYYMAIDRKTKAEVSSRINLKCSIDFEVC